MNIRVIKALVAKDFSLFFRNRFYTLITILGIIFYLIIYFVMPPTVDETLEIGLYAPVLPPVFELVQAEEGLKFEIFDSDESLKEAVTGGEYKAGVALPADIMEKFASGQKPHITLYFSADAPDEIKDTIEVMIRELSYLQTGQPLQQGHDRDHEQIDADGESKGGRQVADPQGEEPSQTLDSQVAQT